MPLSSKQRGVLAGMITALLLAIAAIAGVRMAAEHLVLPADELGPRLRYGLPFELLPVLVMMLTIGVLARHRFVTPQDIDGSGLTPGSERARLLQAVLQNTLEQLVLALPTHLLWLVLVPLEWLAVAPACAVAWVVGRGLFALGYSRGAPSRALGFALTFYPTVLMIGLLLYLWAAGSLVVAR
ncbi:MAG: MAPEG family protein [Myxococcales bacterium]|nr:MAPEG family protein [Myxococcales bacterium]MCB9717052.1 MAPEG family protein [Myxococcales bacterium]